MNSYEHAKPNRRGRQGSWPALGLNIGLVLSSATIFLLSINGDDFLVNGGWRIPFIASILLVGAGMWVRSALPESPEFIEKAEIRKAKFSDVFVHHWRPLLVVFIVAIGYNAVSHIFKTFSLAYLDEFQGISANTTSSAVMVAGLVAIITVPIFGELCDKFGSKAIIATGGAISALYTFVFLGLLNVGSTGTAYLAIGIGTGVLAPMMFSAQGSFLSRQFPAEARSAGVGTAREIGTAVAGGLAPLGALSLVASPTNSTTGVGWVLVTAGVLVVGAAFDQGKRYTTEKELMGQPLRLPPDQLTISFRTNGKHAASRPEKPGLLEAGGVHAAQFPIEEANSNCGSRAAALIMLTPTRRAGHGDSRGDLTSRAVQENSRVVGHRG